MRRGFLSTPSARRATGKPDIDYSDWTISIHALREEGDVLPNFFDVKGIDFYPRPPRGGRPNLTPITALCLTFLSTPSARRATYHEWYGRIKDAISIHALREEGDGGTSTSESGVNRISIHALREEGDKAGMITIGRYWHFYPRPPRGGRPGL